MAVARVLFRLYSSVPEAARNRHSLDRQATKSRSRTVSHFNMRLLCFSCYTMSSHHSWILSDKFCQNQMLTSHHEGAAPGECHPSFPFF
jgi:hypothetical protein